MIAAAYVRQRNELAQALEGNKQKQGDDAAVADLDGEADQQDHSPPGF